MAYHFPSGLTASDLATISFENGLDASNNLVTTDFANWNGDIPATYGSAANLTGRAAKWQIGGTTATVAAGVAGGTVAVYFDPGSSWTSAEKQSFVNGLTLWSDYANISFSVVNSAASAQFRFYRTSSTSPPPGGLGSGSYTSTGYSYASESSLGLMKSSAASPAYMVIDTANYGDITSYTARAGYGISTMLHEEGHLLGLGHTGPYNGTADAATQQFNATDNRLYSTMSYIDPGNSAAQYFSQYTVTGTNWGTSADGYARAPYTPQMLDIVAAQQLYGTSTSTTFAGGQVFGFNCNISDAAKSFFDFTVDITPVVTLWDRGTGNTLDLSGYSTASIVNLNPGTFSSAAGLTNNIGIAHDTAIDRFVGGAGDDVITVNGNADIINGGGGSNTVVFAAARAAYTIVSGADTVTVTNIASSVADTLSGVQALKFTDQTVLACFAAGTRIATARGEIAVEDLRAGEMVRTPSGPAPILWIGRSDVNCRSHPRPRDAWPVLVAPDAFGPGLPRRALLLSPAHAVLLDDVLVPIRHLINGRGITQPPRDAVTYFHIALARHDIVLAEHLPCETLLDTDELGGFDNQHTAPEGLAFLTPCAPIITQGARLQAIRNQLDARAIV
jgi:serralysin